MILACTVFAWSTRVTDRQTDGRTELRWLRRAIAVPAVARKKRFLYTVKSANLKCRKSNVAYVQLASNVQQPCEALLTHLFNAPDIFLVCLALPCIDSDTTLSNSSRSMVLRWEDVTTRPLNLHTNTHHLNTHQYLGVLWQYPNHIPHLESMMMMVWPGPDLNPLMQCSVKVWGPSQKVTLPDLILRYGFPNSEALQYNFASSLTRTKQVSNVVNFRPSKTVYNEVIKINKPS